MRAELDWRARSDVERDAALESSKEVSKLMKGGVEQRNVVFGLGWSQYSFQETSRLKGKLMRCGRCVCGANVCF